MTKADATAADRALKAATRRAIALIRNGQDPRPVLEAAGVCAAVLLGEVAS